MKTCTIKVEVTAKELGMGMLAFSKAVGEIIEKMVPVPAPDTVDISITHTEPKDRRAAKAGGE